MRENHYLTWSDADKVRAGEALRKRSGQQSSEPTPETTIVGPVRPHETDGIEDESKESWHDAREDRWEMACGKARDGAVVDQEEEAEGRAEEAQVSMLFRLGCDPSMA